MVYMPSNARLTQELQALGDRRRELRAAEAELRIKLRELIPEAVAAGVEISSLARTVGVSRPTVYAVLEMDRSAT
jgi:hypothetical protein